MRSLTDELNAPKIAKEESSGFLSSIFSAAHNAANNMMLSDDEEKDPPAKTGFGPKLDSLLKGSRKSGTDSNLDSQEATPNISHVNSSVDGSGSASVQLIPVLLASNVHFEPVHVAPINSIGLGNLTLQHFDKSKRKRSGSEVPHVTITGPSSDVDESSNKLSVSASTDNKVVRRKPTSNSSVTENQQDEESGSDSEEHSVVESEGFNTELGQILDSPSVTFASSKKNKDFHEIFRKVPSGEKLIADYSCALSRDILVQGKMYLSQHYICFNSNILGWVTNLLIPLQEVIQIEKKSTAVLFPNGMIIRTLHHKYVFATFLSRDTTFNLITKVWHGVLLEGHPEAQNPGVTRGRPRAARSTVTSSTLLSDVESEMSDDEMDGVAPTTSPSTGNDSNRAPPEVSRSSTKIGKKEPPRERDDNESLPTDEEFNNPVDSLSQFSKRARDDSTAFPLDKDVPKGSKDSFNGLPNPGPATHAPTESDVEKDANEVFILDHTFKAPLGVVFSVLFGANTAHFINILETQKNFDITKDKIVELSDSNKERHYTYIKPLGGPIGPKQTKCIIMDKLVTCDFSKFVLVEQVTQTPDVPLGNSFQITTKIFLTWGADNSTKMHVVTAVEWSAKSWIKGAIEKGSIDGQKDSMKSLAETVTAILSSGATSAPKKARRKTKSISRRSTANEERKEEKPKELTVGEQTSNFLAALGKSVPLPIPMVSDFLNGVLVLVMFSLVYTMTMVHFFGGKSGGQVNLEIATGSDSFSKLIRLNNHKYYISPALETYLENERARTVNEAQMWSWINDRSQGKLPNLAHKGATVDDYAKQEFEEIVRIAKTRVDQLNSLLN